MLLVQGEKGEPCASGDPCGADIKKPQVASKNLEEELGCCKVTDPFLALLFPRKLCLLGKVTPSLSQVGMGLPRGLLLVLVALLLISQVVFYLHLFYGLEDGPVLLVLFYGAALGSCVFQWRGAHTLPRAFVVPIQGYPPPPATLMPSCRDFLPRARAGRQELSACFLQVPGRQAGVWVLGRGMWGNCDLGGRSSGRFHDGAPAVTVRPMLRQENGEQPRGADPDPGRQETGYSEVGFS